MATARSLYSAFDLTTINNEDCTRVENVKLGVAVEQKHFYKFRQRALFIENYNTEIQQNF
jgi:hypothetical protein